MKQRYYYVYILSNKYNNVLYVGITNDLIRRVYEHKNKLVDGFTEKYNVDKLVYYELFNDPINAITREKQLKGYSRKKKVELITSLNPEWETCMKHFKLRRFLTSFGMTNRGSVEGRRLPPQIWEIPHFVRNDKVISLFGKRRRSFASLRTTRKKGGDPSQKMFGVTTY